MTDQLLQGILIGGALTLIIGFFLYRFLSKVQENRFKVLAGEILQQNSEQLKVTATDNLSAVVSPLKEKITEYRELLESLQRNDLKDRENLRARLTQMIESAGKIELEASQLTKALSSDIKFQGQWGEIVLERILELAGLEKGREYTVQNHLSDGQKNFRPDVIVNLPGDTQIIIDSKVSLTAYFDYVNNSNTEALKALKTSVSNHIDGLSKKNYQNLYGVTSPEFVFLFIPVEGVYSVLLKENPEMIELALKKNIILVSPINLMANLKTVGSLWRIEKQSKGAEELARKAGAMHDKFAGLIDDFEKLGSSLEKSQKIHQDIQNKLSTGKGNLIARAQELKDSGAKTTKTLN